MPANMLCGICFVNCRTFMLNVVDPIIPILYGRKIQKCNKVCQCQLQILPMPTADITLQYHYCENTVTIILSEHDHVRPW